MDFRIADTDSLAMDEPKQLLKVFRVCVPGIARECILNYYPFHV